MDSIMVAVRQAMNMLAKLFSAGEKYASALENIGTFVDESTASFADEAKDKREEGRAVRKIEFETMMAQRKQAALAKQTPAKVAAK